MLTRDTHCELLVDQIRDKISHILEGFKLYAQLFSAIVAGSVTLKLQYAGQNVSQYARLADALVTLVGVVSAVIIIDNIRSWKLLRDRLSELAGIDEEGKLVVPPPRIMTSIKAQGLMLIIILITTAGFWCFNPLR